MRKNVKLYEIAHSRTGDKFNASLISVLPYDRAHLDILRDVLTPEGEPFLYGKSDTDYLNGAFVAWGRPDSLTQG